MDSRRPEGSGLESLVGYYDDTRRLYYAAKLRAGLTPHLRADLLKLLAPRNTRHYEGPPLAAEFTLVSGLSNTRRDSSLLGRVDSPLPHHLKNRPVNPKGFAG